MRALIQSIFDAVACQKDYIENNTDFTYSFDCCLGDEMTYHNEQAEQAFNNACAGMGPIEGHELAHLIYQIIDLPDYYCDIGVHVQAFPHSTNNLTVAAFSMSEEEIQLSEFKINPTFANGLIEYLNKNCPSDGYYKMQGNTLFCHLNYEYSYIGYELKENRIRECLQEFRDDIADNNGDNE